MQYRTRETSYRYCTRVATVGYRRRMKEPRIDPVEYAETIEDAESCPHIEIRVPASWTPGTRKEGVRIAGCHYQPH